MVVAVAWLNASVVHAFPAPEAPKSIVSGALEVGLELFSFNYDEPGFMSESGPMFGVVAECALTYERFIIGLGGSYASGTVEYDGAIVDIFSQEVTPVKADTDNTILSMKALAGYNVLGSDLAAFCPFFGFGYRYLFNDLGPPSRGGYDREQVYYFLPVGVEVCWHEGSWTYGMRAEYDVLLLGEHETSDGGNYEQRHGMGFQGSLYIQYTFPRRRVGPIPSVRFEPFIRHWDIDESTHDIDFWQGIESWEPANNTTIVGVRGSVLF
jgi:hypothetical protein